MTYQKDVLETTAGDLETTFIGHGSLMFRFNDKVIHLDPVSEMGDYSGLPKADIILVTHQHHDHYDADTLRLLKKEGTVIVAAAVCGIEDPDAIVMKNGDSRAIMGINIEAVPAYNIQHMRSPGSPFHPKGEGNGYVIQFGDKKVYVGGDTENIPEMKDLCDIHVAFLPMNLPFTMTPEMAADAALACKPKILYPYHFGDTDTSRLTELLAENPGIEVRIRDLQ